MSKRFIAVERSADLLRIAVATVSKTGPVLQQVSTAPWQPESSMNAQLDQLLEEPLRIGDRMATALAAAEGLIRSLEFPFGDEKKLAASIGMELGGQLPVPIDDCQVTYRQLEKLDDNRYRLCAAAVKDTEVAAGIAPFDREQLPLTLLDLNPFATVDGLRGQMREGVVVQLHAGEASLLLLKEGKVLDFRYAPLPKQQQAEPLNSWVERQARGLLAAHRSQIGNLTLLGDAIPGDLRKTLQDQGWQVASLRLPGLTSQPALADLPVAALALRLAQPPRDRGLNFRNGTFALKSEWRRLQRQLIVAGTLLLLGSLCLGSAAWLNYAARNRQANDLQARMVERFKESFPKERAIVDIPLQMKSKIASLEKQLARFGGEGDFGSLTALERISAATPKDLQVDIRNYSYTPEQIRLEGRTSTFDAVDRLADSLKRTELFTEVRITDAKQTLDGKQVNFRLSLDRGRPEVQ